MSDKTIQLKSPKLGCIPVRPFLIFGSFFGILLSFSIFVTEPPTTFNVIICALDVAFNICLVYGALKYNDKALKYCQIYVISSMIVLFVMLCLGPVLFSSFIASDYHKYSEASNDDIKALTDIFDDSTLSKFPRKIPEQDSKEVAGRKFLTGFIAGEMLVFFLVAFMLSMFMEYVMIKRLRKFIAARKGMYEHVMLV
ncbi:unnamed protein product [Caenorhabditis nigoni]